jgi:peptide/nickel transport system substrate-binding protein
VLRFDQPTAGIFDLFDLLFLQAQETIDTITSRGVGTGPFKLVEWNPNSNIKLARNEAYWRPDLPCLDGIDVLIAPDQQAMVIQLEARAVEVAQNPPPRDAKRLRASSGFTVVDAPHGAQSYGIVLNVTRRPLDHPTVRRAVNHALDRSRFVNTVLAEQSEPWCQPWPKHSIAYVPEYEGSCAYDVEKAKALLREAGLASGFETTITSGSSGTEKELVTIVQSDLAKIGVNARLEVLEESVFRPRRVSGDFDISTAQYLRANKDPSSLLGTTLFWNPDTGNSHFRDPEYKRLIQEGAATLDPARRREIYRQITQIIVEQNFVLPLAPTVLNWAMLDNVRDFDRSLDGYEIFERTWLAS